MSNITKKDNLLTHLNKLTLDRAAFGIQTVDKAGKAIKEYLTDPKTNLIKIPTNIGSDNNNNDDDNDNLIPDSGLNIDPGKSLSGVEQLWTGTTAPTGDTTITLTKEISQIGDGLQLPLQIVKTQINNGQTGTTSILPVVASNDAKPQTGKYVASVPIPISILAKNLAVGKTINCVIDGIGEALTTTKVSQSPAISIYVKDSKTLVITSHEGYALDKKGAGNNGAFYAAQITGANSFTKAQPIPQIPNGSVLFSGDCIYGEVKLIGVNDSFNNVGDGIAIYFNDKLVSDDSNGISVYLKLNEIVDFANPMILLKSDLKAGHKIVLMPKHNADNPDRYDNAQVYLSSNNQAYVHAKLDINDGGHTSNGLITINNNSLTLDSLNWSVDSGTGSFGVGVTINKITSYMKQ